MVKCLSYQYTLISSHEVNFILKLAMTMTKQMSNRVWKRPVCNMTGNNASCNPALNDHIRLIIN